MRRLAPVVLVLVAVLLMPGCIKAHKRLVLQPDLSGRMELEYRVDFAEVARVSTALENEMAGGEPPTEEELAVQARTIREETKAGVEGWVVQPDGSLVASQEVVPEGSRLPEGMELVTQEVALDDASVTIRLAVTFEHFSQLDTLKTLVTSTDEENPIGPLVGHLDATVKGRKVTLTGRPFDTINDPSLDDSFLDVVRRVAGGMEFTFVLETPMKPGKSDADQRKGNVLTWNWSSEEMIGSDAPQIRAVLKAPPGKGKGKR